MSIIDKKEINEFVKSELDGESVKSLKYEYNEIDDFDDSEKTETDEAYNGDDEREKTAFWVIFLHFIIYAVILAVLIVGLISYSARKKRNHELNAVITESKFEEEERQDN